MIAVDDLHPSKLNKTVNNVRTYVSNRDPVASLLAINLYSRWNLRTMSTFS